VACCAFVPFPFLFHDRGQTVADATVGNLATPSNSSYFSKAFSECPAGLPAFPVSPNRRGLEVALAHGFLSTDVPSPVPWSDRIRQHLLGLLATIGLVSILTICLSIYGHGGQLSNCPAPRRHDRQKPPADPASPKPVGRIRQRLLARRLRARRLSPGSWRGSLMARPLMKLTGGPGRPQLSHTRHQGGPRL